ncbi:hypothetical protein KC19_10G071000, partial [Ceratodon purpureus]
LTIPSLLACHDLDHPRQSQGSETNLLEGRQAPSLSGKSQGILGMTDVGGFLIVSLRENRPLSDSTILLVVRPDRHGYQFQPFHISM